MTRAHQRLALLSAGILATLAIAEGAFAQTAGYLVTVDTSSVNTQSGSIDLQFNGGALNTENACATISNFLIDGQPPSLAAATSAGSVTGTLTTGLSINNGPGGCTTKTTYTTSTVNDYNQPITFGNTLSFFVSLNGPGVSSPPTNTNGYSGSSFGVAFIAGGNAVLTSDPSNFAASIALNLDGTSTPNVSSLVTMQSAEVVTVQTSPANLSFSIDGNPTAYTSTQTFAWVIGSQHTLAATMPQGSSGTRYTFTQWSDGTSTAADQITVSSTTATYTANFDTAYQLTTGASPAADGSVNVGTASPTSDGYYPSGTPVSITANPNTGYAFSSWTGNVAGTNSASTTVTMSAPESVTANFVVNNVNVTIGTAPSGLLVSVDNGAAQGAPVQVVWQVGSSHTIATSSPQGSNGTQYTFTGWSDAGGLSHQVTASSSVTGYTASFSTSYLLTFGVDPTGAGGVGVNSTSTATNGYYPAGAQVTLTATPASSMYKFSSWTGTSSSASNPLTVAMNGPISETANFALNSVGVTIATAPSGLLVSIDNGTLQAAPVNTTWVIGSMHTIGTHSPQTAPGTIYTFNNWSDGGAASHLVTTPGAAITYTATFSVQYQLTITVSPSASGKVTPASGGYYAAGALVNLKASANPGYMFKNWSGNVASVNSASTTVTISAPESVTANFTERPTFLTGALVNRQGPLSAARWTFLIVNAGPGAADAAQISSLKLTQNSGKACGAHIVTRVPILLGNLPPGGFRRTPVTINFTGCSEQARFTVTGILTANQGRATGMLTGRNQEGQGGARIAPKAP